MIDRESLLRDARSLTSALVDDLRDRSDSVDEVRQVLRGEFSRAEAAGRTERAYEDWREDLLAQVAVGWVLASVFVRFCEDNQLVDTPLLSGPGARRDLARDHRAGWLGDNPALGDREWLTEVFDRYAAVDATAELFGERNPLRLFGPSADGARALLDLWWQTDDDGQLVHDFTDHARDTRFLGDLYQDLSDHAKQTYALLQTPVFVEEFILEHTLDPAIETFGLDETRMIDPTCGSGHFLLGGFDRLIELWKQREPSTPARALAQNALDAVAGVDINPFAVSVARFRLLLAAMKASGIARLEDAPAFTINVAVGDSLLHGTRPGQMFSLLDEGDALLRHRYPGEDGELAHQLLTADRYQAVVGNPPYITAKDPALSTAYRQRYQTCHRQYSLGVPFTERFFDLAASPSAAGQAGYVGMITANSFMKRDFGEKLIEELFAKSVELSHIIDSSGAHIPAHGTPTVILFGRSRLPNLGSRIRTLVGLRKEPAIPADPRQGLVWSSILDLVDDDSETESDFVAARQVPLTEISTHPWMLMSAPARRALEILQGQNRTIADLITSAGRVVGLGEDEVWLGGVSCSV